MLSWFGSNKEMKQYVCRFCLRANLFYFVLSQLIICNLFEVPERDFLNGFGSLLKELWV